MSMSTSISICCCCFVIIGCFVFVEADEASKCYSVNSENYCFYMNGSVMNWNEARQFCAGMNSTLPIIRDEDIDKVFQKFIVNDSYNVIQNRAAWIGARARPVDSSVSWHWINGRQSALTSSQSSNHNNRKWCATVGKDRGSTSLYTNYWTDRRHYVCRYDLQQQFSSTTSTSTVNCSPRWIVYHNSRTKGATNYQTQRTPQQCLQACVNRADCSVVEWTTHQSGLGCWMHYKDPERERHPGVTQFEIVRSCYSSSDRRCDDAFLINFTCYKIHKEPVPWFTAVNRCLSKKATLAVFDDDVRQYFPSILLSNTPGAWIGLIKSWWTWPDSTDVLYNKFNVDSSSPPDNPPQHPNTDYNCVVDTTDGQWKVARCDQEQHLVVCQSDYYIQPEPTTTTTKVTTTFVPYRTASTSSGSGKGGGNNDNTAAVAGAVVVVVVVIIIVVVVVVVVLLKRRRSRSSSDHQSQNHHHGEDAASDPYAELHNIGADNAAHLYSALNNVPTRNHIYANVSP